MAASVGFVGLGNMGAGMARNLARGLAARAPPAAVGKNHLMLFDLDAASAADLAASLRGSLDPEMLDISVANSVGEVAASCRTACLSLPSEAAGEAVVEGLLAEVL